MIILQKTASDIILNLEKSLNILDAVSDDNFENLFPKSVGFIEKAGKIKNDFGKKCTQDDLNELEKKIYPFTKLLKEKFDNIIVEKQNEILDIAKKLNELNNKKKLVKYSR